jgi:hypothetical protein
VDSNELVIEVYFVRKGMKILIEQWSLTVYDKGKLNDISSFMTMIRSVYTYSRILPAFTFFKNTGLNCSLDACVYFNDDLRSGCEYFTKKRHFINNELTSVKLSIEYIDKCDIFKIEEEMVSWLLTI